MTDTETLSQVADTVLDKPITIEVDILHPKWFERKKKRTFEITGITLGSLIKISKELISIDVSLFKSDNLLESNYNLIVKHADSLAKIIAYAVVNSERDPPASLVKFFLHNLNSKELYSVASIVLKSMNIQDFMLSILSLKGTNILQTGSPKTEEIIAPGEQSEEL